MSGFGNKGKRDGLRENWPLMLAFLAAVGASEMFGPIVGLIAMLGVLGLIAYRRRQAQD
jgi:LPXTG-motif cell wall-anchored protein